jgi:truncated hemoglobin YjbI
MDETERKMLHTLAGVAEMTRYEVDAMRILLQAALQTIASNPALAAELVANVQRCSDADAAIMLSSQLTDRGLEERANWIRRLMPPQLLPKLQLP